MADKLSDHLLDAAHYGTISSVGKEDGFNRRYPQNELRVAVRRVRIAAGLESPEPPSRDLEDALKHTYSAERMQQFFTQESPLMQLGNRAAK